jgi:hypothetical protein
VTTIECAEKLTEEPAVDAAGAHFARSVRLKIFAERRSRLRPQRRHRRKIRRISGTSLNTRRIRSRLLSPWPALSERASRSASARGIPAHEAAHDFGRRAAHRFGIERVAAEKIDLLELREEAGTGIAAGNALHFGDRQELACLEPIGKELVAAVVVAGDHEDVAANAGPARGSKPVRPVALDELDEPVLVSWHVPAERVLLIRSS